MQQNRDIQHVYLVGAKSLGAYGGYETFIYKLTEYHQYNKKIKYHVACKANGDGYMDESKLEGTALINDHEFESFIMRIVLKSMFRRLARRRRFIMTWLH